jgi:hypothetical protein
MEATEKRNYPYYIKPTYMRSKGNSEIFVVALSDGCPATANLLSLDASLMIPTCVLRFEAPEGVIAHRLDRCTPPVRPA